MVYDTTIKHSTLPDTEKLEPNSPSVPSHEKNRMNSPVAPTQNHDLHESTTMNRMSRRDSMGTSVAVVQVMRAPIFKDTNWRVAWRVKGFDFSEELHFNCWATCIIKAQHKPNLPAATPPLHPAKYP